jgi:hypothetical protein
MLIYLMESGAMIKKKKKKKKHEKLWYLAVSLMKR